jgi:hypothetical protein
MNNLATVILAGFVLWVTNGPGPMGALVLA